MSTKMGTIYQAEISWPKRSNISIKVHLSTNQTPNECSWNEKNNKNILNANTKTKESHTPIILRCTHIIITNKRNTLKINNNLNKTSKLQYLLQGEPRRLNYFQMIQIQVRTTEIIPRRGRSLQQRQHNTTQKTVKGFVKIIIYWKIFTHYMPTKTFEQSVLCQACQTLTNFLFLTCFYIWITNTFIKKKISWNVRSQTNLLD